MPIFDNGTVHAPARDYVEEESDEAADRTETTVFFFLQFLVGVLVLADYMLGQEWPQGGFLCQWAYFSSVVMYKPFTVPMWFCLLLGCHYTFAERLFGGCTGEGVGLAKGQILP